MLTVTSCSHSRLLVKLRDLLTKRPPEKAAFLFEPRDRLCLPTTDRACVLSVDAKLFFNAQELVVFRNTI